ncbi:MAG: glutamine synthetase III [Clostridia bacterium]|nr:glutamine synthetase III [Clostridia bacterium]
MGKITSLFSSNVFSKSEMKKRVSPDVYEALTNAIDNRIPIPASMADEIAKAMMEWAISLGCTHYSHWFMPLTNITAEKHDSFLAFSEGKAIEKLSGKSLVRSEVDASSFPSGNLRGTFNARGYSIWDPTSYAFVRGHCLYIPACMVSYNGQALDRKTPLLRSIEALSKNGIRILRLCGNTVAKEIRTSAGPEQEYFLIKKEHYLKRPDLIFTGRTLIGAKPPKGQELDDNYFAPVSPEVNDLLDDFNKNLWKLGINATTEHREAAPGQFELAPIYSTTNLSNDTNTLTMQVMREVADQHGYACLFHEKPFAGLNGSGKHNNWSLETDLGENLLTPTDNPYENTQFLLMLAAAVHAVGKFSELMRISVASAGNDFRLGALEAPPAIVSVYLGDELSSVVESVITGKPFEKKKRNVLSVGVPVIPEIKKDNTDRNRTSPFAFTGNKFEFRMSSSSQSIAEPNIVLNTIMADVLGEFADRLEGKEDFESSARALVKEIFEYESDHIIFNGNGYSKEWQKEASRRGLPNLRTTPDAFDCYDKPEYVELFERHHVFTSEEISIRKDIGYHTYASTIIIEARTLDSMIKRQVIPAVLQALKSLDSETDTGKKYRKTISDQLEMLDQANEKLEKTISDSQTKNGRTKAIFCRDNVRPACDAVRKICDELETITPEEFWPFPSYADMLLKH